MPSMKDFANTATNLPKTDWVKMCSTSLVVVVMIIYCVMGYLKNRKYNKMLEKAAAGKGGTAALRDKLLPDDLRKKIGDIAGFGWVKALTTFFLSLGFVFTMTMMP